MLSDWEKTNYTDTRMFKREKWVIVSLLCSVLWVICIYSSLPFSCGSTKNWAENKKTQRMQEKLLREEQAGTGESERGAVKTGEVEDVLGGGAGEVPEGTMEVLRTGGDAEESRGRRRCQGNREVEGEKEAKKMLNWRNNDVINHIFPVLSNVNQQLYTTVNSIV